MFRTINGNKIDLASHIKEYLTTHKDVHIYVGSDSQNKAKTTTYVTTVVMYSPGKGGHIVYNKVRSDRENDKRTRLIKETMMSLETANLIIDNDLPSPEFIDLDINGNKKFKSFNCLEEAMNIVCAYGFKCRCKTTGQVAAHCADWFVRS